MNEEIEYAEMLEIPVSTVNVVKKQRRRKQKTPDVEHNFSRGALGANDIDNANNVNASKSNNVHAQNPLRDSVIAQVNDKLREEPQPQEITADAELFAESANSEACSNDPPENRLTIPKIPPKFSQEPAALSIAITSTKGT